VPEPSRPPHGPLSRRSAIGLALAGLGALGAVTACSSSPSPSSPPTADSKAEPASVTPDVQTATEALVAVRAAHQAVRTTVQRFPATRAALARLETMHTAHERSLVDAVPARERGAASPAPYVVPRKRDAALTHLQASEATLRDTLQALSLRAQSGEFARLLASMAAAVTVQRQATGAEA
jgi:hypothetical protein